MATLLLRCRVEKNWGFLEHQGELKIFYSTLPCTAVYKFDTAAPTAAVLVTEVCYSNIKRVRPAARLQQHLHLLCMELWGIAGQCQQTWLSLCMHAPATQRLPA